MPGGLINVVAYGSEDIFLTGTPQITYFKAVYRHHTNFAIESIAQYFITEPNFGEEACSIINKGAGDLMARTYLEVDLPRVFLRKSKTENHQLIKNAASRLYQQIYIYSAANSRLARKINILVRAQNIPRSDILRVIESEKIGSGVQQARDNLAEYLATSADLDIIPGLGHHSKLDLVRELAHIDIRSVVRSALQHIESEQYENNLIRILDNYYHSLRNWYLSYYSIYIKIYDSHDSDNHGYKFAWVKELGHALIQQINIQIGDQIIDTHTSDWFIIYNDLFLPIDHLDNYNRMIGNIDILTDFNSRPKSAYKLIIPLQFWFCRGSGMAIPLVALRYHDIMINLKFRPLEELCCVDTTLGLSIANIQVQHKLNIVDSKLYIDYIYLDTDERKRFAESSHEYLIEFVQFNEISNFIGSNITIRLSFDHPTKFISWFIQPMEYRSNLTGWDRCRWGCYDSSTIMVDQSWLRINLYDRTDPDLSPLFYNTVQPYLYFNRSPRSGLYTYSFAINPTDHQPSGSINLSRIDDFSVVLRLNSGSYSTDNKALFAGVYAFSYNILRIMSGMAALAFHVS